MAMFESLSDRLSQSLRKITGKATLTEENIQDSLREVRMALLEADVALPVVKSFIDQVRARALGQAVSQSLDPGQQFLKIVQEQLEQVMGSVNESLNLAAQPPAVILMAGLQGAGKTTSAAKLALYLQEREKKKSCWSAPMSTARPLLSSLKPWPEKWVPSISPAMQARNRWILSTRPSMRPASVSLMC